MWARLMAVAAVVVGPVVVWGQALAERVPEDALVFVSWSGTEGMGAGFEGSNLKAFLEASNVPQLMNDYFPKLLQKLAQQEPQVGMGMGFLSPVAGPMWRHPSAIYVGPVDLSNPGKPQPRLALLCQAGDEAAAMAQQLRTVVLMAKPPVVVDVKQYGGLVTLAVGRMPGGFDALVGGPEGRAPLAPLAKNAAFRAAMGEVNKEPVATAYVNAEGVLSLIDQAVTVGNDQKAKQMWPKVKEALGLNGLKGLIATGGFDGKDWGVQCFISAPAPRQGLLALLDASPVGDEVLSAIPKTAIMAGVVRFDAAKLLSELRAGVGKVDPGAQAQFDEGMAFVAQMIGMDVQKDVLDPVGDAWGFYVDPMIGGNGLQGLAVFNRLRDAGKAERALLNLERITVEMVKEQIHDPNIVFNARVSDIGGLSVHHISLPLVTPSWAIKDGNLYLGLYPQVVVAAAGQVSEKGESILANEKFAALRKRVGGEKAAGVQYYDLSRTIVDAYPTWLSVFSLVHLGDWLGVESPAMVLPPLRKLMPFMTTAGAASWSDDAGWHVRSISPFPGAEVLATNPMGGMMMNPAMIAGIALPAVAKARQEATQAKDLLNLRQIGAGVHMYAVDHNEQLPPDMGALVAGRYVISAEVFIKPDAGKAVPGEVANAKPEEQAAWVNLNGDYVYVGAGKKIGEIRTPATTVLAYERLETAGERVGVLFADGHVEVVPAARAKEMVEAQGGAGKNGGL